MNDLTLTNLLVVIFLATFLSTLASGVLLTYWIEYRWHTALNEALAASQQELDRINQDLAARIAQSKKKMESALAKARADAAAAARESETLARARSTNRQICNFWTETYARERTDYNKAMRDSACARARGGP